MQRTSATQIVLKSNLDTGLCPCLINEKYPLYVQREDRKIYSLMHGSGYVSHSVGYVRFGVRGYRRDTMGTPRKEDLFPGIVYSFLSPCPNNDNPHDRMMS